MTAVIPVGFGVVTFRWRLVGGTRDFTVAFAYDPPAVDPEANANSFNVIMKAAGNYGNAAAINGNSQYMGLSVTEMHDTGPLIAVIPEAITGGISAQQPAPNWSLLVRKRTAAGGRRNRGRLFLPPVALSEANIDQTGTLAGNIVTSEQTRWTSFRTSMVSANLNPVLLHSTSPFTPTPVTALEVQALGATQRRRMRR